MTNKVKGHIEFHYLLTEILLCTLFFFGIECVPRDVLNKIKDKFITHSTFRLQSNDTIWGGLYCMAFIKCMISVKTLLDNNNLFSVNDYQKTDKKHIKVF